MAISFDGPTKLMVLSSGTTNLNVSDLYSRWKDWVILTDNSKFLQAFTVVGGDPIDTGAGTTVPFYNFLLNGWRVKPQEASHTLAVSAGILLVDGGGDPFVNPDGVFTVRINYQQPVQAITVSTGGGGDPSAIADAVLDEIISAHQDAGSLGEAVQTIVDELGTKLKTSTFLALK